MNPPFEINIYLKYKNPRARSQEASFSCDNQFIAINHRGLLVSFHFNLIANFNMAVRVFITGISGYIGGQLATDFSRQHSEWQVVGLVRNEEQAQMIRSKLPSIQTVLGDLSSLDLLFQEAKKSNIVVQCADCDNVSVVESLIKGLSEGGKGGSFIQMSGSASNCEAPDGYGNASSRVYDDIKDLVEITTFDSSHMHWDADQATIKQGRDLGVKTALVVPGLVYGEGDGPIKTKSMTFPWLEEAIIKRGKGFTVGQGKNSWSGVHVKDLASVVILLIEDALRQDGTRMTWGDDGVYYVSGREYVLVDVVTKLAEVLSRQGLIQSQEVEKVSEEEAVSIHPYALLMWGSNSRSKASRLQSFGWKPIQPTFYDMLASRLE